MDNNVFISFDVHILEDPDRLRPSTRVVVISKKGNFIILNEKEFEYTLESFNYIKNILDKANKILGEHYGCGERI